MEEIRDQIERIEALLPRRVDPATFSKRCKVPYKVMDYRAAVAWRYAELAKGAFEGFEASRLANAVVLTRGAVETAAALWFLYRKVDEVVNVGAVGDLDDAVMRLLLGTRDDPRSPSAMNVLTMVDGIDRVIEGGVGFREQYDHLSEVAHPNWAGTLGLYGKTNYKGKSTDFGPAINEACRAQITCGPITLSVAGMVFEHSHRELGELMPALIRLCEKDLEDRLAREGPSEPEAAEPADPPDDRPQG